MFFKLIADTFSVARDAEHFIQTKTLKKPKTDDQIWTVFDIEGDSKYARSTIQSITETLEASFFDHFELSAYERFEAALKEVNLIVNNLKEKRGKSFGKINAIVAVFSGEELHLTQANDAEAYMIRNQKLSLVSEGLGSRSPDLFVNIASGELRPDDKLAFSTGRLLRLATHSQIVQLFHDGVAEAIEALRELTTQNEELSLGAVCIHVKPLQKADPAAPEGEPNQYLSKLKEVVTRIFSAVSAKTGRPASQMNKKSILIALVFILVILAISVSVLIDSRRNSAIREEYRIKIEKLHQDIQSANTKGYANDKETANGILDKVEKDARAILETNYFRPETLALLEKAQESRDSINNTDRVKEMAPYVDLKIKQADVKAVGLLSLQDNLYAYTYNKFFEIILDQVMAPRTVDENEVIIASTAVEDQKALVFLTQSGRVAEFSEGVVRFASTDDQKWKPGVDVAAFGKNIYILSPQNNQIYKYSRLRAKYSAATAYNSDADLKDAISLAIDGDMYVLRKGGQIIRIYKSKQQQFAVSDLAVDLSDATKIFTSPELDNLYVFDPKHSRIVMIAKAQSGNARYYGQIVFDKLTDVQDFFVDKSENKLYLLTNGEIYRIDI